MHCLKEFHCTVQISYCELQGSKKYLRSVHLDSTVIKCTRNVAASSPTASIIHQNQFERGRTTIRTTSAKIFPPPVFGGILAADTFRRVDIPQNTNCVLKMHVLFCCINKGTLNIASFINWNIQKVDSFSSTAWEPMPSPLATVNRKRMHFRESLNVLKPAYEHPNQTTNPLEQYIYQEPLLTVCTTLATLEVF